MGKTWASYRARRSASHHKPPWHGGALAAGARLAIGLSLCVTPFIAAAPAGAAGPDTTGGQKYYVDCAGGDDSAAGTAQTTAWRSLDRVNKAVLQPGDSILLRSGTTCKGVLAPHGSGTASRPVVVTSYGGTARAAIAAGGARAAVLLENAQGWELRNLDVSNHTTADGTARIGIYVLLTDFGTGTHYVVDNVNVHDVTGTDSTGPDAEDSGGIVFKAAGSKVPTGFDGIQVSRSTVSGTDGYGIATSSQWSKRELFPGGSNSFVPLAHIRITGNRLSDMGGDGIVVQNGADPLIDHNLVDGFGLRATAYHSGIWAWNSDRPVMEYNEVTHGASSPPAMAYDVDGANANVVYQYNYSHDNGGGFITFCNAPGQLSDGATVRYNISQNDHDATYSGITFPVIFNGCGVTQKNVSFYNNVVYSTVAKALVGNAGQTSVAYRNNIFRGADGGSTISDTVSTFDHNLYFHITDRPSADAHALTADPRFTAPGTGSQGYRLKPGSPALGAGVPIPDNGGHDYYGHTVPAGTAPAVGAAQGGCP
ncbi:right-handed parallel beta-helix repeat-containing protein [Streptomyces sp. NPDC049577]|uniref:right-handed parallel beta-helix repeat-containing protein n=1 Tax=Streptomyces sp. NPDC049577 TaxID=3155153 RepID=UPI00341468D9